MALFKDTVKNIMNYFEMSDEPYDEFEEAPVLPEQKEAPTMRVAASQPVATPTPVSETLRRGNKAPLDRPTDNLQRLNTRQKELSTSGAEHKTTIDIKFPKRYEDAPDIINLLLENASVLIDFQYMTEQQARRCLDYLDGARSVLAGNLKKVSSTMWLLTPVNVTVNIEDLRKGHGVSTTDSHTFDYDMRR